MLRDWAETNRTCGDEGRWSGSALGSPAATRSVRSAAGAHRPQVLLDGEWMITLSIAVVAAALPARGVGMNIDRDPLDEIRIAAGELENHYIDEFVSGSLSRREFLRRGSVLGISIPAMAGIVAATGRADRVAYAAASSGPVGSAAASGTLRVAQFTPAAYLNPLKVADIGGLNMLAQTGEFLIFDDNLRLALQPMLATSWSPNEDGSVWTFKLRPGVTFHNGASMTSDDVVYTFQQLSDPTNASNALSMFEGVLSPSGVQKIDSMTVAFRLESPNGNFPYLVSSDNYNAIVVPNGTDFSTWQSTFIGTGVFKFSGYSQGVDATFTPNPSYWGAAPLLAGTRFTFFVNEQSMIAALERGDVDLIAQITPAGASAVLNNPLYRIIRLESAIHRELSMRTDQPPFSDSRVRRAVAYTVDRARLVRTLLHGFGSVGDDNPFAPRFNSRGANVSQRHQDLSEARRLLDAAGHHAGVAATLTTERYEELPQLARQIAADAHKAGIDLQVDVLPQARYFGNATFGHSPWLDATMSMVDYGDRGIPNSFLEAPLTSTGPWNAARFHNRTYDSLVKQYVAAVDLQTQKRIARKIEQLLLRETPIIIPYWINGLTATTTRASGVNPTSIGQINLAQATTT
jgi:peptide/nickel transport system substrate-binding protein